MTDKVELIRGKLEHVIERRLNLLRGEWFDLTKETVGLMNEVFDIFTEESMTSVWRDSSKEPLKPLGTKVLALFNDGSLESLTIEDMKAIDGVIKWAYVDDLLKL